MTIRQVGRCKLCHWRHAKELNKLALQGNWSAATAKTWAQAKNFTFERKTWYTHRNNHMEHPSDALVSYSERAAMQVSPTVTNTQFLEAVRDIGFANAKADPGSINLTQSLKAVALMEKRNDRAVDLLAVFAKLMAGARVQDVVTIEGQYTEVPLVLQ